MFIAKPWLSIDDSGSFTYIKTYLEAISRFGHNRSALLEETIFKNNKRKDLNLYAVKFLD